MDRADLPEDSGRQHDGLHFPAVGFSGVPGAFCAVRELVAAPCGDPHRADDAFFGHRRCFLPRRRQQRFHANQFDRAGRFGLQKRDFDRGVRPRKANPGRHGSRLRGAGGLPVAVAADSDDLAGFHHGRDSVGAFHRRRFGDAPRHRRSGFLRHAGRDGLRLDAYASLLRCDPRLCGTSRSQEASEDARSGTLSREVGGGLILMHTRAKQIERRVVAIVSAASLSLLLAACSVGPKYKAPQPADAQFHAADSQLVALQPFDPSWWKQFEDPVLDDLMQKTLTANTTIRIARARLAESRAAYDVRKFDRYPTVTADGTYTYAKESIPGFYDQPITVNTFHSGFDAFWEIDVFGRVRHNVNAARNDEEAFQADLQDVRVSVAAELARNYFELRGAQWRLAVAQRSLE